MFYISPSGNTILTLASCFVYEQCVYIIRKGEFNLEMCKNIYKEKPLKEKYISKYTKCKDYTILTTLEWISAPMSFFIKNNFSLLDIDEYKETIKLNRKRK